jgi:hypothetical protein
LLLKRIALRGSARAVGAHVCGARRINRHAHVAAIDDQEHFAPAGAKKFGFTLCAERVSQPPRAGRRRVKCIFSSKRLRNSLSDEVQLSVAKFSSPLGGLFAAFLLS